QDAGLREPRLRAVWVPGGEARPRRRPAARGAGRRVLERRAPRQGVPVRQADDRAAEGADPAAALRRRGPGIDRFEDHRARDREGEAQRRAGQVLRRRHHAQAQAPGDPEEGERADAARRPGRRAAGGVHRGAPRGRGGEAQVTDAGVYVHIPFCLTRCGYCDFNTYAGLDELKPSYLEALLREADLASPAWDGQGFVSVFLGGGTPTTVAPADLRALLARLRGRFDLDASAEITVEANPDTVTEPSLTAMLDAGYTRISIGAQSFDTAVAAALERDQPPAAAPAAPPGARPPRHPQPRPP